MIFCVEDDMSIRELVSYTLEATGLQTQGFEDGAKMMELISRVKVVLRRSSQSHSDMIEEVLTK